MVSSQNRSAFAYDYAAQQNLAVIRPIAEALSAHMADDFYKFLADEPDMAETLRHLSDTEFVGLQNKLRNYVGFILSDRLTDADHRATARRLGRLHGQLGIRPRWLIQLYSHLQSNLQQAIRATVPESEAREAAAAIVCHRIFADLREQFAGYEELEAEIAASLAQCETLALESTNFNDLVTGVLELLGGFTGTVSAFFARVDHEGELQIEASAGAAGPRYHQAMESGEVPRISIDPDLEAGRGPGGRAWRESRIICSDAWSIEAENRPWHELGRQLGFRSSAAVPILNEADRTIALLSLYAGVPRFFSAPRIYNFLLHLQQMLSHAVQRFSRAPVIPLHERQRYRRLLDSGRVTFHFQPIIDLDDGALRKLEGLARLIGEDDAIVEPKHFMPAFGSEDLFRLFAIGLDEGAKACREVAALGTDVTIALNFPAEGMGDPRFIDILFARMRAHGLPPHQIQLEILEGHDFGVDETVQHDFLRRIRDAGIRIAEDDLGSGHSSLLRLDRFGFDDVKIDQALVQSALYRPERALEFILYLTRLAHSFDMKLTVEGLANAGMVEAAAILGADYGQGYGIARPMPLDRLVEWHRGFRYKVEVTAPKTALGALAAYLGWCMRAQQTQSERRALGPVDAEARIAAYLGARPEAAARVGPLVERHFAGEFSSHEEIRGRIVQELTLLWFDELAEAGTDA